MSEQEFAPQSQKPERSTEENEEIYSNPSWRTGNILKDEHPSTFEESIPPYSYQAQDSRYNLQTTRSGRQDSETVFQRPGDVQRREATRQSQRFSPDGDAMEYGYRPYRQERRQARTFVWMSPPRRGLTGRTIARWLLLIGLSLLLIKVLPALAVIALTVIGVAAFLVLLPIFLLLGIVLAFAVLVIIVLAVMGVPLTRVFRVFRPRSWGMGR